MASLWNMSMMDRLICYSFYIVSIYFEILYGLYASSNNIDMRYCAIMPCIHHITYMSICVLCNQKYVYGKSSSTHRVVIIVELWPQSHVVSN